MSIILILQGHLRHYTINKESRLEIKASAPLCRLIDSIGIPRDEVTAFFIEGKRVDDEHVPDDGDTVEIIPAISGG
jgi:sulfur carrier protein ThiS